MPHALHVCQLVASFVLCSSPASHMELSATVLGTRDAAAGVDHCDESARALRAADAEWAEQRDTRGTHLKADGGSGQLCASPFLGDRKIVSLSKTHVTRCHCKRF